MAGAVKIVTVTLAHAGAADMLLGALASAPFADEHLVFDTSPDCPEVARALEGVDKAARIAFPWPNSFAAARNHALGVAGGRVNGIATWATILDTDERMVIDPGFDLRAALAETPADVLLVKQDDGSYAKERFFRIPATAYYVGHTHEVSIGWRNRQDAPPAVRFTELGKSWEQLQQKRERDLVLLRKSVDEQPTDPRWHYYLGDTLAALGRRPEAIAAFDRCAELRGWDEESAWACYRSAEERTKLEDHQGALDACARGLARHAGIAELAWLAGVAAARLGRMDQAGYWARMAVSMGCYAGAGGLVPRIGFRYLPALYELPYDVLRFAPLNAEERAKVESDFLAAKLQRLGGQDLERLSVSRAVPKSSRDEARQMLRPAVLATFCPSARTAKIDFKSPNGWRPMNPSVCWHNGKVWCVVRTVNYTMNGRHYVIDNADGVVRTENFLGQLTQEGKLVGVKPMRDLDPAPRVASNILGYEDVRLVSVKGVLRASATVCDRAPDRRLIARLTLDAVGSVKRAFVQPSKNFHEKNWMPLAYKGHLVWLYSLDPTIVTVPKKSFTISSSRDCPLALEHLRGGAVISLDDGYLCVTHEVVESNDGRIYLHRFVALDSTFTVTAVTPSWVFGHHGVEFCAGLVRDGEELLLTYGVEDREAWFARVPIEEVRAMQWITP